MAKHYQRVALFLLLAITYVNGLQLVDGRIKITVGTASGCGDTVRFINEQLVPTYELYGSRMDIEFLPWGRTRREADGSLVCQFGPNDCWANRVHLCALNLLKGNVTAQLNYMTCEFNPPYPAYLQGSYVCGVNSGLSIVDLDYCASNPGDALEADVELRGTALTQVIDFIPSIMFHDVPDKNVHNQAIVRLSSMVCFALAEDPTSNVTNCSI